MTQRPVLIAFILAVVAGTAILIGCKPRRDQSAIKAQPVDRKVLGAGLPYQSKLAESEGQWANSMANRRRTAWFMIDRLLEEVQVGEHLAGEGFAPTSPKIPMWQTWYESSEFKNMFRMALDSIGKDNRKARKPICPETLESIFKTHAEKKLSFRFPPRRFKQRLGQFKSAEQVQGVSGTGVTMFSPGLLFHYLLNYKEVYKCNPDGPARADSGPESDNFSHCFQHEFTNGIESLYKGFEGDFSHCSDQDITSPEKARKTMDEIGGAVAVKTSWAMVNNKNKVALFDTSATGMANLMESGLWEPTGVVPSQSLKPDDIYTIEVIPTSSQENERHQLTALHFMTKDTREWTWITMWWSDKPDQDYGADRPQDPRIKNLNRAPWKNYKMCVVTGYNESDSNPGNGLPQSLKEAVEKAHEIVGPHTWCSNPFIEHGKGNAKTNCIGCHQHAGTDADTDDIYLDDPADADNEARRRLFPNGSRSRVRQNFPGEYLWSFSNGPDFFQLEINEVIGNFDADDR